MLTTQTQVRAAFWDRYLGDMSVSKKRLSNGDYSTDTRCAFVDYVDNLARDGQISEKLAQTVTL